MEVKVVSDYFLGSMSYEGQCHMEVNVMSHYF